MFELYEDISVILSIALGVTVPLTVVLLLIQYYMHKKIFDPAYYNAEYFSEGELVVFSAGFVFYLSKTTLYIRAITLPNTMRIRFKENILTFKQRPFIYVLAWVTLLLIAYGGLAIINLLVFLFLYEYYG